jgi:hypothetical protein
MGSLLMVKMTSARTQIWPAHGHYMGLNLGLFWQTGGYICADFGAGIGRYFGVCFAEKGRFLGILLRRKKEISQMGLFYRDEWPKGP